MLKKLLLLLFFIPVYLLAQDKDKIIIEQKFVFHQLDVLETGTNKVLDSFPDGGGMILNCKVNNQDYLIIDISGVHTYQLQIVNKVEDIIEKNLKIIMYQGGEKIENIGPESVSGTYTANVFYVFDLEKNKYTPDLIRLEINGSSNIMQFSGIIKLIQ